MGFAVFAAVERRLADPAAAATLERQLAAAQAGQPAGRRLQLQELRVLCLLESSSALLWEANSEVASTAERSFHKTASRLKLPTAAFGPPCDRLASAALAACEQALRLGPPHPRMAVGAAIAIDATGGSWQRQARQLRSALRLAEAAGRPYWVCKAAYALADTQIMAAQEGQLAWSLWVQSELAELLQQASHTTGRALALFQRLLACLPACMQARRHAGGVYTAPGTWLPHSLLHNWALRRDAKVAAHVAC